MTYKQKCYKSYRSTFKGNSNSMVLNFGAVKLQSLLAPWVEKIDRNSYVVDLGCGAGELLLALQNMGFKNLSGCDISAEQCEIASQIFPEIVESDIFNYLENFRDNSIPIITIFDVIEHLTRNETFSLLELIFNKLSPGGILIAHLPNGVSPFVGHIMWGDITHEWCLTPQSASTLCRLHGFIEFEAVEHLGSSQNAKGKLRSMAWYFIRSMLKMFNKIETGSSGGNVWTRNFAFKAEKPITY